MAKGLQDIRNTLSKISQGGTLVDMLCEFERTLDNVGIFTYQNWLEGELLSGPEVSKYWFKTSWMFYKENMPDPDGAMRLKKIGCNVWFEEDVLEQPRKILSPEDWEDGTTKKAKIDELPVWIVHIEMPIKYITDGHDEIHRINAEEDDAEPAAPEPAVPDEEESIDDELDKEL